MVETGGQNGSGGACHKARSMLGMWATVLPHHPRRQRPEAMRVTWDDVKETLLELDVWSKANGYMYTVANHTKVDAAWVEDARVALYSTYEKRESELKASGDNEAEELLVCPECNLGDAFCSCEGRRNFVRRRPKGKVVKLW